MYNHKGEFSSISRPILNGSYSQGFPTVEVSSLEALRQCFVEDLLKESRRLFSHADTLSPAMARDHYQRAAALQTFAAYWQHVVIIEVPPPEER